MRIINQRGDMSIEFDGTEISQQNEAIVYQSKMSRGLLGKYDTAGRADEVFMEIHKAYEDNNGFGTFEMPIK